MTAAYPWLVGWFVLGLLATGLYVVLALLDVTLLATWPLLAGVCVSIFKCCDHGSRARDHG